MYSTKDTTVPIVLHCLLDACGSSRDDLLDARHVTAQLHVNLVAAIPQTDDGTGCCAKCGVRAQVVLMVWRGVEERSPPRINKACVGGEVG